MRTVDLAYTGPVDMAAYDAVEAASQRVTRCGFFEAADVGIRDGLSDVEGR